MTTPDSDTHDKAVHFGESPAQSSPQPLETAEGLQSAVLVQIATQASACTKIIAGWLVALSAFGFFGVWQTEWKLHRERPEWSRLDQKVKELRRQVEWQHQQELTQLLYDHPRAFEDISIPQVFGSKKERIPFDFCTALELKPDMSPTVASSPSKSTKTDGAATGNGKSVIQDTPAILAQTRLSARGVCKQIEHKRQEISKLDEKRQKLEESLGELPLKTPLFETKVVTSLAPLVQMILLAAGIYYVDRKRREMLYEYLRAARLANLFDSNSVGYAERVERFNREVRQTMGPAPLWLLPFPLASKLPSGVRVEDTLGRDARGGIAWASAATAAFGILIYAISLFLTVTGVDLALLDREVGIRTHSVIDLHFSIALALVWLIGFFAITTVLPWTPATGETAQSKIRRRLLFSLSAGYIVSLPIAAIISRGHLLVGGRIPRIAWISRVANAILPGQPRLRSRLRWAPRWHSYLRTSNAEPEFVMRSRRPYRYAIGKIAYVFSSKLRRDNKQLFGIKWVQGAKYIPLSLEQVDSMFKIKNQTSNLVAQPTLSLTFEVAALDQVNAGNLDDGFKLLRIGIEQLEVKEPNSLKALRLYDLFAAIAVHHGRQDVLDELCEKVRKRTASDTSSPKGQIAKYIDTRKPMRRRRDRQATPTEETNYRLAQWSGRVSRWSRQDSRWYVKWQDKKRTWKIGLSDMKGQGYVVQRSLSKLN